MKKRIISMILALVMVVLTLASCGAMSLINDENLESYATFDKAKFVEALGKLEIAESTEFSADPAIREIMVKEAIYNEIATAVTKADNKLYSGKIGAEDIIYYCYYATYTDGGVEYTFNFSDMKESAITSSSTKANHVLQLGAISENDDNYDFASKLKAALKDVDIKDLVYSMSATSETLTAGDTDEKSPVIVISYTRTHTETVTDDKGTADTSDDTTSSKAVTEKAGYETVTLSKESTNALIKEMIAKNAVFKVGSNVSYKDENDATKSTFSVTIDGTAYTYSEVKIQWKVKKAGGVIAEFEHTPYTSDNTSAETKKVAPDNLVTSGKQIDLKNKALTYHVYPVYYYDVPANDATGIIKSILGSGITTSSLEIFEDEAYKNGDKTIKALVEELKAIYDTDASINDSKVEAADKKQFSATTDQLDLAILYCIQNENYTAASGDSATIAAAKTALATLKELKALLGFSTGTTPEADLAPSFTAISSSDNDAIKAIFDKKAEYEAISDKSSTEAAEALKAYKTAITTAYNTVKGELYDKHLDAAISNVIAEIAACKKDGEDKTAGEVIYADELEEQEHTLTSDYKKFITDSVGTAIYELMLESVKITSYPDYLIEEFYDHLYESYEYKFYKEDYSTDKSNYSQYGGDFEAYLKEATGANKNHSGDYVAAITAEAKSYAEPLIKIYIVSKAFESEANASVLAWVDADIAKGAYDAHYVNDDSLSEAENAEAKAEAEESAKKNKESARKNAQTFIVTDEVFEDYKKEIGSAYDTYYKDSFGERNLRAALQFNRLFYFFTATKLDVHTEDGESHAEIVEALETVGEKQLYKVQFHNSSLVKYSLTDAE